MAMSLERLRDLGLSPGLIFDVGAFRGDFARLALSIWPEARVACFDPLAHGVAEIARLQGRHLSIDCYRTLVGAEEKASVQLRVANASTSLLPSQGSERLPVETVPQTTIDLAVARHYGGRPPDFLKIDVQGYELEVLKGAQAALAPGGIEIVLAEVNLLDLHEGVPLLDEVAGWLAARDYVAYDICGFMRRPFDNALWQADMIFVRRDSPLRRDKRYFRV